MKMKLLLLTSIFSFAAIVPQAYAQTDMNAGEVIPAENCRADSNIDPKNSDASKSLNDESLTDQLNNCGGVFKPPKVGDREIEAPAPQVGTMPIIPPGALPEQRGGVDETGKISRTEKAIEAGAEIDQIVGMIAKSADVARQLENMDKDPQLNVINISVVFQGAKSDVLKTALRQHQKDVEKLRSSLAGNKSLAQNLNDEGVPLKFVVAASVNDDGSVNIFMR